MGIRVLAEKSLIDITSHGYVILHQLVEQMGRQIMLDCQKFLGDPKEIHYALVHGAGTELTECISLHTCEMAYALSMKTSVLNRMHNLKFLKIYEHVNYRESKLQVTRDDHNLDLPHYLRLLHWDAFPLTTLPLRFNPLFLVELNLRHSNVETLWTGNQGFKNLERLDLTGSNKLKQLPDLSYYKNLDKLILEQCTRLKGIPKSIGYKSSIRRLNLSYYGGRGSPMRVGIETIYGTQAALCIKLVFPTGEVEMELKNISITGDIEFHFSKNCQGYAEYFYISSEQQIPVTTAISVHLAPRLRIFTALNIRRFNYKENGQPVTFHRFPDIPCLKEVKLINLNIQLLPQEIGHLEFLEKLDLSGNDFNYLPVDMSSLSRLKTLRLRNCRKLKELPELAQVRSITVLNCGNLRSLVKLSDASREYCLLELCLDNCKNVKSLSDQLSQFTKLTYLDLSNHDFKTLPSSIRDLTSLVTLCLNNCKKLKSVDELPLSLQFLYAHGCDSLEADALEHFNETRNKQVPAQTPSPYFQETEMSFPSYERDHKATKFLCCSYF